MVSVAYVNITVHYSLKNREGTIERLSHFFLPLFETLNMYCVKALGVGHFKGNWTNEKKKQTTSILCLSQSTPHTPTPRTVINNRPSSSLYGTGPRENRRDLCKTVCARACVCVETGVRHLRGVATWRIRFWCSPVNKLRRGLRGDHMAPNENK